MPKPEIEFTHVSSVTSAPLTPSDPAKSGDATVRILSYDPETRDQTSILTHPPGSTWGAPVCVHNFWEEAFILEGRIYDETLKKWFEKGSFCCRPPWMKHGPYKAGEEGCEEICYWRYQKRDETGTKILPKTMRKSSGLSTKAKPSLQVEPQEVAKVESQSSVEEEVPKPEQAAQPSAAKASLPKQHSTRAAYLATEDKKPPAQQSLQAKSPELVQAENQPSIARGVNQAEPSPTNSSPPTSPQTPKRQSRLAAYLAAEEKKSPAQSSGSSESASATNGVSAGPSSPVEPPRRSRLAAYRTGVWDSSK